MTEKTRHCIEQHWASANARDWESFAALLDPALVYHVPQTRECIRAAAGYLDLFRTWPGPWQATIRELICEGNRAVCRVDFVTGETHECGISFFELTEAGQIVAVTDYWPEPYEPPVRHSSHFGRM